MAYIKRILTSVVFIGLAFNVHAIVYTLQKGYGLKDIRNLLKTKHVLKDTVTVNGNKGSINVYLSPLGFSEILTTLKPVVKNDLKKLGKGTVVIDVPGRDWTNRLLVLNTGTKAKVVVFQLRLPKDLPKLSPAKAWPPGIPLPMDATVDSVMVLKKSQSTFCQFSSNLSNGFFNSYDMSLGSAGWSAVSSDNVNGGVYMNKSNGTLLILSTWNDDKRAYGSVYLRPITNSDK